MQPYAPNDASDTVAGVTLQALSIAHTEEETATYIDARWENGLWKWGGIANPSIEGGLVLRDEDGRLYEHITPSNRLFSVTMEVIDTSQTPTPPPPGASHQDTLWFEPVPTTASQLTLEVNRVGFRTFLDEPFTVDLGENPQMGGRWALDVRLDVGGFPVHITGVRLEEGIEEVPYKLVFETEVEQGDERILEGLTLGFARGVDFGGASHGSTSLYSLENKLEPTLSAKRLPESPFTVVVDNASMAVYGPWTTTWDVLR